MAKEATHDIRRGTPSARGSRLTSASGHPSLGGREGATATGRHASHPSVLPVPSQVSPRSAPASPSFSRPRRSSSALAHRLCAGLRLDARVFVEYIWLGGSGSASDIRSATRILDEAPSW